MPYPPPHGPPGDSIFQGIGLNPEEGLPDQTGHAGDFLETDGTAANWEPVSDILPPQTGHGGQFLTTDGTSASWAPVPSNVFDITNYGAVPNDATFDNAPAIYAAIAAWTETGIGFQGGAKVGGVFVPPGIWYVSRPIVLPPSCTFYGVSHQLSIISAGVGTPATSSLASAFGGPLLYLCATTPSNSTAFPPYASSLVGSGGHALVLQPNDVSHPSQTLYLDDCFLSTWLGGGAAQFDLRFWYTVTNATGGPGVINSCGPNAWLNLDGTHYYDQAFGFFSFPNPGGPGFVFQAVLSTVDASGNFTINTTAFTGVYTSFPIYVELAYDGTHFDFYINGVNQSHIAATGSVYKTPWESISIGAAGPDWALTFQGNNNAVIDSIEFSDVARHTGTGSYTPPSAKHTADSHTMWLANWDQGQGPFPNEPPWIGVNYVQPFVMALTRASQSVSGTDLVTHYIKIGKVGNFNASVALNDIGLNCSSNTDGVALTQAPRTTLTNVEVSTPAWYGLRCVDGESFYSTSFGFFCLNSMGPGMVMFGTASQTNTTGCRIGGVYINGGKSSGHNDQPGFNSFIPFVLSGNGSASGLFEIDSFNNDEEGHFIYQRTALFVFAQSFASLTFTNNIWDTSATAGKPPVIYAGSPLGVSIHKGDSFVQSLSVDGPVMLQEWPYLTHDGHVKLDGCVFPYSFINGRPAQFEYPNPLSNLDGWVSIVDPSSSSSQSGISITPTLANNLAGTFTVLHGFTAGGPLFAVPEFDSKYQVIITLIRSDGSSPAAGSTTITGYTTRTDGFTATVGADPAGTCQLTFGYMIVRTYGDALLDVYAPAIPSTDTNPLVANQAIIPDFLFAGTIVPVGVHCFAYNNTAGLQYIADCGTSSNEWSMSLFNGVQFAGQAWGATGVVDSFVRNGRLYGLYNPGPHNVGVATHGAEVRPIIDGGFYDGVFSFPAVGTQQTPLHVGEKTTGADGLTLATIRNFKVDRNQALVLTNEPDVGPGSMTQCAFFGDRWIMGREASTSVGGFATQIAEARYGTQYFWMACADTAYAVSVIGPTFWSEWGFNQTLSEICIFAGWLDIVQGALATDVMSIISQMCQGFTATAIWDPPSTNSYGYAKYFGPYLVGGTATCVINGRSFNCTQAAGPGGPYPVPPANSITGINNLIAAVNADAPTAAIGTASLEIGSNGYALMVWTAKAPGTAGNGISTTSDGFGGAGWYPANVGFPFTAFGIDTTVTIAGVTFLANFFTDANTTVNDVITLINASAPTLALVTPSNIGGAMLLTAVNPGNVGNTIAISSITGYPFGGGTGGAFRFPGVMTGGKNGAIQNGTGTIVLCNIPPFGSSASWTAPKETQRLALNTSIASYASAHSGDGVVLADVDLTMRDPSAHVNLNPTYDSGTGLYPNTAGHTAMFGLINPLLP